MRRFLSTALLTAAIIAQAAPALAGGARLEPSRVRVDAGNQVELTASVPGDTSAWMAEAPFFAYLSGAGYGTVVATAPGGAATDVRVGELSIEASAAATTVRVLVTIPDQAPAGEYEIVVCNEPCTTGFGGLGGGPLYVGMDPPASGGGAVQVSPTVALATSELAGSATATTTYLALGHHPERSTQVSPLWIALSAALGAVVLVTALASRNRG